MLKRFLLLVYYRAIDFKSRLFNFVLPNLFCKNLTMHGTSKFLQKTYITGTGRVEIGKNCSFGYKLGGFHRGGSIELQARSNDSIIKIGDNVETNNNVFICSVNKIEIGDNTLIGQNVTFIDSEAHGIHPKKRKEMGELGEIIIGKNVWIGNNVTILKNTSVGNNSIIAAGAVVTGNFGDNIIIGGIPARVIKTIEI